MCGIVLWYVVGMLCLVWIDLYIGLGYYGYGEKIFNSFDFVELECVMCIWGVDV